MGSPISVYPTPTQPAPSETLYPGLMPHPTLYAIVISHAANAIAASATAPAVIARQIPSWVIANLAQAGSELLAIRFAFDRLISLSTSIVAVARRLRSGLLSAAQPFHTRSVAASVSFTALRCFS